MTCLHWLVLTMLGYAPGRTRTLTQVMAPTLLASRVLKFGRSYGAATPVV